MAISENYSRLSSKFLYVVLLLQRINPIRCVSRAGIMVIVRASMHWQGLPTFWLRFHYVFNTISACSERSNHFTNMRSGEHRPSHMIQYELIVLQCHV